MSATISSHYDKTISFVSAPIRHLASALPLLASKKCLHCIVL